MGRKAKKKIRLAPKRRVAKPECIPDCIDDDVVVYAGVPSKPTDALPGTAEKKRVLAERFSRGEDLFHPDDPSEIINMMEMHYGFVLSGDNDRQCDRDDS